MPRIVLFAISSLAFYAIFIDRLMFGDWNGVRTFIYITIVVVTKFALEYLHMRRQKTIVIHRSPTEDEWHEFMRNQSILPAEDPRRIHKPYNEEQI